jgi:pantetheine-phosphate adenylyltransferase
MRKRIGIYPGSFDPLTNGHLDIVKRAADLCDLLYVAIARNTGKEPLFTIDERVEILKESCPKSENIKIVSFEGLLADFCGRNGVQFIIRGLRGVSDFEYELGIALMNKRLDPEVETLFLAADSEFSFVSSRIVKEVALSGGDISPFVPQPVIPHLQSKISGH